MLTLILLQTYVLARSLEAYVTAAASPDAPSAPHYIYGALSLIGTIRANDERRDILVLIDVLTLAVYPTVRGMFERNNVTIIETDHLNAANSFRDETPRNWLGAMTKMSAFQLLMLGYTKLLFLDADGVVLSNPDRLFALPITHRTEIYGMRDFHGCTEPNDSPAFMSACFLWGVVNNDTGSEHRISLSNRLTNILLKAASGGRKFFGGQRILSEIVGDRLQLLEEGMATCPHRCMCRQDKHGLPSLRNVVYAHFMKHCMDTLAAALEVIRGRKLNWVKSTEYSSYEIDCMKPAYLAFTNGLNLSLRNAGFKMIRTDVCSPRYPRDTTGGVCSDFIQTSSFGTANLSAVFDGNVNTCAVFRGGCTLGDHITVTLAINRRPVERIRVTAAFADLKTRLEVGVDYDLLVDDRPVIGKGWAYRKASTITLAFKHDMPEFVVFEIDVTYLPKPLIRLYERTPAYLEAPPETPFDVKWRSTQKNLCVDAWHCLANVFDGNNRTETQLQQNLSGFMLTFEVGKPLIVCGVVILSGATIDPRNECLKDDSILANNGTVILSKTLAAGPRVILLKSVPFMMRNLQIVFGSKHTRLLRIGEIILVPPTIGSNGRFACS